jgi:hypothetical protein
MLTLACHACGRRLELAGPPGRRDECPHCAAELRCCRQCLRYDEDAALPCREPQAEVPAEKHRANFCEYFAVATDPSCRTEDGAARARAAFDALFAKR